MKAGSNAIQQTLTPEAAAVLNQSVAEAGRRKHGQTTPLHVAAMLLKSPSGVLRQACIWSHRNSSHPLLGRALELCFGVALDRLPAATGQGVADAPPPEPPISNALLAALKRAQARQRRACPEQHPLLALKVELKQLIISILDDPTVSRVMREAKFSSIAVKASVEQSLKNSNSRVEQLHIGNTNFVVDIDQRTILNSRQIPVTQSNRSFCVNPLLPHQPQTPTAQIGKTVGDEVKKVFDIMSSSKKRNPILVGISEPEAVAKGFFRKIKNNEFGNDLLNMKNSQIVSIDKCLPLYDINLMASKMDEFGRMIESRIVKGGVILDLGNLRWLVEQPAEAASSSGAQQLLNGPVVPEARRAIVVEISKLLVSFGGVDGVQYEGNKLSLIGTATYDTYTKCMVYHPTMESDWGLQAVTITSTSPIPRMFPRLGPERIMSNPLEPIPSPLPTLELRTPGNSDSAQIQPIPSPLPGSARLIPENLDPTQKPIVCPQCSVYYQKDVVKFAAIEQSSSQSKQDEARSSLPWWLQNAKGKLKNPDAETTGELQVWFTKTIKLIRLQGKDQGVLSQQKTQELLKKWRDTCLYIHPDFHQRTRPEKPALPPNLLEFPPLQPINVRRSKPVVISDLQLSIDPVTPQPAPPIRPTSPVLTDLVLGTKFPEDLPAKDLLSCISSEPQFSRHLDASSHKNLLNGLMENAWWQAEAASAVATAVMRNSKQRGCGRNDSWLLFAGPDRVAKRKMARVLAEQISGSGPVIISLGPNQERGRTAVDRIVEAVRRNPCSVIVLRDIDEADNIVRGNVKRAIDRGWLADSHGREVGLGSAVFIVTGDWSTISEEALRDGQYVDERKVNSTAGGSWQLGLIVREKIIVAGNKRRASHDGRGAMRMTRPRLRLELNLGMLYEEESSDVKKKNAVYDDVAGFSIVSLPYDLASVVDESIVFGPVQAEAVRREIKKKIAVRFSEEVGGDEVAIEIGDDVADKILGGVWHDETSLEQWVEGVIRPSFEELKMRLPNGDRRSMVVRLVVESDSSGRGKKSRENVDWLPNSILV
ncbi:double Clp-N motif-containing P-loop nucleosidetriphosphate hydrolases superfamily protein [Striga asiatica]|uniref:Double Clp-N motif-containing P-loop nucleosidetriphosphate hydrolases superfamily protein n=1 Tax=Striga asiatica TaxID=4170 RepID=A0A5A7R5V1_STRAF|nr:double Clp-N motif-containing P-loop nucleosidetriphosphate hydrolases superfamily protein [Striga asiatica]